MRTLIADILRDDPDLIPLLTDIVEKAERERVNGRRQLRRMEAYANRPLEIRIVPA